MYKSYFKGIKLFPSAVLGTKFMDFCIQHGNVEEDQSPVKILHSF